MADARAFVGVVGLVNSLRLLGHDEPVLVLDCGLTDEQRACLDPHVRLVEGPPGVHPTVLKAWAPLAHPADVMVVLDADIVVVQRMDELIGQARTGCVIAFKDSWDRHHVDWGARLGVGSLPRRPYVNAGHLLISRGWSDVVLGGVRDEMSRLRLLETVVPGGPPHASSRDEPFFFPDQDMLNAVLAARVPDDQLLLLDSRLAPFPPFQDVRADAESLRCVYPDGMSPYLLHHVGPKPWVSATPDSVYAQLLRRLLTGGDVPIRVSKHLVPPRFRTGPLAWADRHVATAQAAAYIRIRGRLGIRPRLEAWLARGRLRLRK
jgi:hypothetical protein